MQPPGSKKAPKVVVPDFVTPLGQMYAALIRPPIRNESIFDIRARLINQAIDKLTGLDLEALVNVGTAEILRDLKSLMPTGGQIAASRNASVDRYE